MACVLAFLLVAAQFINRAACESTCAPGDDASCTAASTDSPEQTSMLQAWHRSEKDTKLPVPPCPAAKPLSDVGGKSIYLILVDRFARTEGSNMSMCDDTTTVKHNAWCGGTLKGIVENLDYIQGMGFECIWITPVIKQYEGPNGDGCVPPPSQSGCSSHGYWAYDWYEIDPHFGTKEDLQHLSAELHKRDMCFVYDFVTNHVGPIHSSADVAKVSPFNLTTYFHTLNITELANDSFDKYAEKVSGWPPPVQGIWSGAQCSVGVPCNCFKCPYDMGFGKPCNVTPVFDASGPCPEDPIFPFCMAGDFACEGYNETVTHAGWFYDLGDLNQSVPAVRDGLLKWGRYMVDTFDIDVVRLDTASYMPLWFLSSLQEAVCVPILGEATVTNMTFHAQLEANPPPNGKPVLKGVLNFPLTYAAIPGFCGVSGGNHWPYAESNLTWLGHRMTEQMNGLYKDLNTLGQQIDNHDMDRIASACHEDMSLVKNAIAWNMLAKGAPTIYYGTEVFMTVQRRSLWQYGWKTDTVLYKYLATLNALRKTHHLGRASNELSVVHADETTLTFKRGKNVWIFLNNLGNSTDSVKYCHMSTDYPTWLDAMDNNAQVTVDSNGCFVARSSDPVVLVECRHGEELSLAE